MSVSPCGGKYLGNSQLGMGNVTLPRLKKYSFTIRGRTDTLRRRPENNAHFVVDEIEQRSRKAITDSYVRSQKGEIRCIDKVCISLASIFQCEGRSGGVRVFVFGGRIGKMAAWRGYPWPEG